MATLDEINQGIVLAAQKGDVESARALKAARDSLMASQQSAAKPSWSDLPGNIIPSAEKFYGGLANMVAHPIQTAQAAGNAIGQIVPGVVQQVRELSPPGEARGTAPPMDKTAAIAAEQGLKDRYGSLAALKNTAITDPVGSLADASTILMGPEALGLRGTGRAAEIASALSKTGRAINPVAAPLQGAALIAPHVGPLVADVLGRTTGAGSQAIKTAASAGAQGGVPAATFKANISGQAPVQDVVKDAAAKLSEAYKARNTAYQTDIAPISADTQKLPFGDIDQALVDTQGHWNHKGQVVSPEAKEVWTDIKGAVADWQKNGLDTPGDMDALKKKIGNIRSGATVGTPAFNLADTIYGAVEDTITAHAPDYAKVMADYSAASDQLRDIRSGLSLGGKTPTPTKLGKLLSAMKANTGTGQARSDLLSTLAGPNDQTLAPALAGQALNPAFRTGLGGTVVGAGELLAAALHSPQSIAAGLAALPVTSPRLAGETAYYAGGAAARAKQIADIMKKRSPMTASQAALVATLAAQNNGQNQ